MHHKFSLNIAHLPIRRTPTFVGHSVGWHGVLPNIHTRTLSEQAAWQPRKGRGQASAPPSPNFTRPHALKMGGGLGQSCDCGGQRARGFSESGSPHYKVAPRSCPPHVIEYGPHTEKWKILCVIRLRIISRTIIITSCFQIKFLFKSTHQSIWMQTK